MNHKAAKFVGAITLALIFLFALVSSLAGAGSSSSTPSHLFQQLQSLNLRYLPASIPREERVCPNFNDIVGATFNPNTHELILIGRIVPELPTMDYAYLQENLAVAMRAVHTAPEYPGVTIGTTPSPNPSYQSVEYFGDINDTHYGYIFFEADRLLKSYSLGRDNLHPTNPFTSSVPGYISFFDRYLALQDTTPNPISQRFWFSPTLNLETIPGDPYGFVFSNTQVNLLWAYLPGSGTSAKSTQAANDFVNHFNAHYQEFAAEQMARGNPTLHRVVQLFKLFGVAYWTTFDTVQLNVAGVTGPWLNNYPITFQNTPDTTPTVSRTGSIVNGTITISGGVTVQQPNDHPNQASEDEIIGPALVVMAQAVAPEARSIPFEQENIIFPCVEDIYGLDSCSVQTPGLIAVAVSYATDPKIMINGSFEDGPASSPWEQSSSNSFELIASGASRSGSYGVYLADYANADESIYQQVTIPATANRPMLVYHWLMFSDESLTLTSLATEPSLSNLPPFITLQPVELWTPVSLQLRSEQKAGLNVSSDDITTTAANDFMTVQILDTGNNVLQTLQTVSNDSIRNQWQAQGFSLDAYKGKTIRIRFRATNNATNSTGFLVDDVSLDTATNIQPPVCNSTITSTFVPIILKNAP